MNKNTGIIIGVLTLIVIVGGVYMSMNNKSDALITKERMEQRAMEERKMLEEKVAVEQKAVEEKKAMMESDVPKDDVMMESDTLLKKDEAMKENTMKQSEQAGMKKDDNGVMLVGSYEAYSSEKVALASPSHDVVLFFRASWCPSCKAVDGDIKASLGEIPASLTILDVNYDDATALKQKYGVTYQHTFVQVDAQGNLLKKWSGSPTLSALVAEVQ